MMRIHYFLIFNFLLSSLLIQGLVNINNCYGKVETRLIWEKGNGDSINSDISETSFSLIGKKIVIEYVIEGEFDSKITYSIYFFDSWSQEWKDSFGYIKINYLGSNTYHVIYNKIIKDQQKGKIIRPKTLSSQVRGSSLTITGLDLNDIGNKYTFYVSAKTYNAHRHNYALDLEPRVTSGNISDSYNYHSYVGLPLTITFNLTRDAGILIDDQEYIAANSGTLQLKIPAGEHTIKIITPVGYGVERKLFIEWDDKAKEPERKINLTQPSSYSATYKKQYYLKLWTSYGKTNGTGWYDSGTIAEISITPISIPMMNSLGILSGTMIFDHWEGDLVSNESYTSLVMNSPKEISAVWNKDFTNPILFFTFLFIIIAGAASFKNKKTKRLNHMQKLSIG